MGQHRSPLPAAFPPALASTLLSTSARPLTPLSPVPTSARPLSPFSTACLPGHSHPFFSALPCISRGLSRTLVPAGRGAQLHSILRIPPDLIRRSSVPLRYLPFFPWVFLEIPKGGALVSNLSSLTELCRAIQVHDGRHWLLPAHVSVHHCSV